MAEQKDIPLLRFHEFNGDWEKKKIKELAEIKYGKDQKQIVCEDGKYPIMGTGGEIGRTNVFLYDKPSVMIGRKGTIDKPRYMDTPFWTVDTLFYTEVFEDIDPKWLYYKFETINWYMYNEASGVPSLSSSTIYSIPITTPILPEQQKIASFFTAIDQKISQLKRKKTLLEQYKKGGMQKIFSQQIRFKDDKGQEFPKWEKKKVGLVIDEYRAITKTNNEYEVLTSSNKGLMLQKEYYGENRITERDNIGFNVLPNGYITYRSRSDNGIFTFNLNNLGITGIVSKYYPVFKIKDGSNYFLAEFLNDNYKIISQYSIGTSQKVFPMNAFNNISLRIPCPKEQHKIANFLSAIDDKINHTQKQIGKAEDWKKGLTQQMFV